MASNGRHAEVRASIGAMKGRNGPGAKGGREMEMLQGNLVAVNRRECSASRGYFRGGEDRRKPDRKLVGFWMLMRTVT